MALRYWVGGTANWDGTAGTKWALTSGGAGGQTIPTINDDVFFTNLSTGTCTILTGAAARSVNCTGFTGGLAGGQGFSLNGTLTLVADMTYTHTGTWTFAGSTAVTLTTAGKTLGGVTISKPAAVLVLGDALTVSGITTLLAGTLALGSFTLNTGIFSSSNSTTRVISFGTGNIVLTSATNATTILNVAIGTNLSYTGTGGFIRNQVATATVNWGASGFTNGPDLTVNAGASTLTIQPASNFKTVNFTGSTCEVIATSNWNSRGNLTLASNGTYTNFRVQMAATSTITSNGRTIASWQVSTLNTTVSLGDALTVSGLTAHTQATLNLAGFTLSTGTYDGSSSNTRVLAFGTGGNVVLTSTTAAATVLSMSNLIGFSYTGTGGFIRNQVATATISVGSGGGGTQARAPILTVNGGESALTISGTSHFKTVNFTDSSCSVTGSFIVYGDLTLSNYGTYTGMNPTFAATTTFSSLGKILGLTLVNVPGGTVTLGDALILDPSSTFTLTAGTLNLNDYTLSTGTFISSNSNTRSIAFGNGNIVLTRNTASGTVLDMGTATNFTYTGTGEFTRNQVVTTSLAFGSVAGGTVLNAPNLTVNSGAATLSINANCWFNNINFTGSTCAVVANPLNVSGNLNFAVGGQYTLFAPIFRNSSIVTTNGKQLGGQFNVNATGIVVTLDGALTLNFTGVFTLTEGTFNSANFNVAAASFSLSNSNTRTLDMGSGTWTITGSGASAWDTSNATGLTLNPSTSTINMSSASAKTFAGGDLTYYNLNQGGAGALTIQGNNTFNNITNTVQPATVTFTAGTTQTVSNFGLSGTAGNLVTINSSTPGSQFTLSDVSGTVDAQYLSIRDSNATGGAIWNALSSTNLGNNTGWIFPGGNMFLMFM